MQIKFLNQIIHADFCASRLWYSPQQVSSDRCGARSRKPMPALCTESFSPYRRPAPGQTHGGHPRSRLSNKNGRRSTRLVDQRPKRTTTSGLRNSAPPSAPESLPRLHFKPCSPPPRRATCGRDVGFGSHEWRVVACLAANRRGPSFRRTTHHIRSAPDID
jgi:hypothetical protein